MSRDMRPYNIEFNAEDMEVAEEEISMVIINHEV